VDIIVGNHGVWPPQDAPVDAMGEEQMAFLTMAINVDKPFLGLIKYGRLAQLKAATFGRSRCAHSVSTAGQRGEAFPLRLLPPAKGAIISMVKGTFHRTGRATVFM